MALRMREYAVHADYVHIREYEGICKNEDAAYLIHIIRMHREKHRKNCECCPVSQLIVRQQRMS